MWGIIIALLSGLLMSVQGVMNTGVTKQTSIWVAAGFVQLTALIVCFIAWLVTGRQSIAAIGSVTPKYMLAGGVIGLVMKSMELLGPAQSVMLIVGMQIVSAYVIELFGILGTDKVRFSWGKLVGAVVCIAGIVIFCLSGKNAVGK